jgi:hypothetical protein
MVTLRLADDLSSNTMMRSTRNCRIIADGATTSSLLNKHGLGTWLETLRTTILSAGQHLTGLTRRSWRYEISWERR